VFYCEPCRVATDWPASIVLSYGRCEICGQTKHCHDVPSFELPTRTETIAAPVREELRFAVIEVQEGGAERLTYITTLDEVITHLTRFHQYCDYTVCAQIARDTVWSPGMMMHYPCGWIICRSEHDMLGTEDQA